MLHEELIAIIEMPVFCGGLKPPLCIFIFAEKVEDKAVAACEWRIQTWHVFFDFPAYNAFVQYFISFLFQ